MNKKITFVLLMAIVSMTARAYTYYNNVEIGNFKYYIGIASSSSEESFAYLQGLSSAGASLTSLDIKGYVTYNGTRIRVTRVDGFKNKTNITSVKIGYGVEEVAYMAFQGCTALKYVLMPSSIKAIGNYAFENCTALEIMTFAGDVPPTLQYYTFNNSGSNKKVSAATYRGMNALKADSKWVAAFGASNIKRQYGYPTCDFSSGNVYYVIKNGIPYNGTSSDLSKRSSCVIVGGSFSSNTTVTINNQVSNTDNNAPGQYRVYGVVDSAFMNNTAVTEVKSNYNQASRIGERAFYGCTSLTSVEVTADTVGNYAFYGCSNLTSATLYKEGTGGVEYIGSYAFGLSAITTATIPSTTKYIGFAPFYYSPSLASISVNANNTNYCSYKDALYNKPKTQLYQIPCKWQYGKTDNEANIADFPETLQRVLQYAATGSSIKALYLPYNVKTIDAYAFQSSHSLTRVHLPSSVTTVASNAFNSCDAINCVELNLTEPPTIDYFPAVTDKNSVTLYTPREVYNAYANSSIWSQYNRKTSTYDHTNCWDIKSGYLTYTVTSTSPYSHNGYSGDGTLRVVKINEEGTISIPSTKNYAGKNYVPTEIGCRAAHVSQELTITQASTITGIQSDAFYKTKLTNFPFTNVETIGNGAFYGTTELKIQLTNLPHLETIDHYAFNGSGLTKFVAPTTLNNIGNYAFRDCKDLHEIFLPQILGKHPLSCSYTFFGNNASDFKCWVDYRRLDYFLTYYDNAKIRPHLLLESEWQSFACIKDINFQNTGLEAYIVSDYNPNKKMATLIDSNNMAANTGAVVHGNSVGTYYRLNYGSSSTNSSILVGLTDKQFQGYSNSSISYFVINPTRPVFDKVIVNTTFPRGSAYLKLPTNDTGGATTIYTNLSGTGGIPGDVNGDGNVTAADVTALYDLLLNNDSSHIVNGDQNGDGNITAADITAVYDVLLSN